MKKFMFLHFGFEKPTPEIMGHRENGSSRSPTRRSTRAVSAVGEKSQEAEPKICRWAWSPSPATTSSKPKTSTRQKKSHKTIYTSQASEFMKLGRCKTQSFMKRYLDDGCLFMSRLNRSPHFTR